MSFFFPLTVTRLTSSLRKRTYASRSTWLGLGLGLGLGLRCSPGFACRAILVGLSCVGSNKL